MISDRILSVSTDLGAGGAAGGAWLWAVSLGASPEVSALVLSVAAALLSALVRRGARWARPRLRRWGLDVATDGQGVRVRSLDVLAQRLGLPVEYVDLVLDEGDELELEDLRDLVLRVTDRVIQ